MGARIHGPRARTGFGRGRPVWVRTAALIVVMAVAGTVLVAVTLGLFASLRVAYTTTKEHLATAAASNRPPERQSVTISKGSAIEVNAGGSPDRPAGIIIPEAILASPTPASPVPPSASPETTAASSRVGTAGSEPMPTPAASPAIAVNTHDSDIVAPASLPMAVREPAEEAAPEFPLALIGIVVDSGLSKSDPPASAGQQPVEVASSSAPLPQEKMSPPGLSPPALAAVQQSDAPVLAADPMPHVEPAPTATPGDQTAARGVESTGSVEPVIKGKDRSVDDAPGRGPATSTDAPPPARLHEEASHEEPRPAPVARSEIAEGVTSDDDTSLGNQTATTSKDDASHRTQIHRARKSSSTRSRRNGHPVARPQHRHVVRVGATRAARSSHHAAAANPGRSAAHAAQFSPFPPVSSAPGPYPAWPTGDGQARPGSR